MTSTEPAALRDHTTPVGDGPGMLDMFEAPDIVDLAKPDEPYPTPSGRIAFDIQARGEIPRLAIARAHGGFGSSPGEGRGGEIVGMATRHATALADAGCGIPVGTPPGHGQGWLPPGIVTSRPTLRWHRWNIAVLDAMADELAPGWRDEPDWGAYLVVPWCGQAFGPVNPAGDPTELPARLNEPWRGRDRDMSKPSLVGEWMFELPVNAYLLGE